MPRGGPRAGSGRKAGSPNRRTKEIATAILESGLSPLEYMLQVMRSPELEYPKGKLSVEEQMEWIARYQARESMRLDAAKAAAPYVHPKLANVEHSGPGGGAITVEVVRYA